MEQGETPMLKLTLIPLAVCVCLMTSLVCILPAYSQSVSRGIVSEHLQSSGLGTSKSVTFADGDFASDWITVSLILDDPTVPGIGPGTSSSVGPVVRTVGGNPGAWHDDSIVAVNGDIVWVGGFKTTAVYTPSASGEIATVDFSTDLFHGFASGISAYELIVKQGGVTYFAIPFGTFGNGSWKSYSRTGIKEADFDTNPNVGLPGAVPNNVHPNFSANGGPITFGYVVGNGVAGGPGATLTIPHGTDNWSVVINIQRNVFIPLVRKS
jgi:hypothetical protein